MTEKTESGMPDDLFANMAALIEKLSSSTNAAGRGACIITNSGTGTVRCVQVTAGECSMLRGNFLGVGVPC